MEATLARSSNTEFLQEAVNRELINISYFIYLFIFNNSQMVWALLHSSTSQSEAPPQRGMETQSATFLLNSSGKWKGHNATQRNATQRVWSHFVNHNIFKGMRGRAL